MLSFYCYYCTTIHFSNSFCIDYANRTVSSPQWPGSREFEPRVKKFGHPCDRARKLFKPSKNAESLVVSIKLLQNWEVLDLRFLWVTS